MKSIKSLAHWFSECWAELMWELEFFGQDDLPQFDY